MSPELGSTCPPPSPPFVIFALPRSRTAWLSRFLTYGDWACGHDEIRHFRSLDDIKAWLSQPHTGTVETAGAPWWRTLQTLSPATRIVVVRRPVSEVVDSLMRLGFTDRAATTAAMVRLDRKLDQIEARVPGVLSISFADLATEAGCARLFEHCLPYRHDPRWWAALAPQNIQISMAAMVRYAQSHRPQMDKLAAQVRWLTLDGFAKKPSRDIDGLDIKIEPFETAFPDSRKAIQAHLVGTDQYPEPEQKNVDLMRRLDAAGALQVVTARCNGRVFGYLMTVIGPSLDSADITSAVHTSFFASPEFRGLGMKLQRVARDALRDRGVTEVIFRAGMRGDGPRMSTLYRRLGAEAHGQLFRLEL